MLSHSLLALLQIEMMMLQGGFIASIHHQMFWYIVFTELTIQKYFVPLQHLLTL
jgi:hypothetical protein